MKANTLVCCILLLTLVLFLLFTVVQATDCRETKKDIDASDILDNITKGHDVNLTNCNIVGELNVSQIQHYNVSNPKFNLRPNQGTHGEELLSLEGLASNLSAINSSIIIQNSIFEKELNLSNVQFNNTVSFQNTIFKNDTYFNGSTFNKSTDFSDSFFNGPANFYLTNFSDLANFNNVLFRSTSNFANSTFKNPASFNNSTFKDVAKFYNSTFINSAYFNGANFESNIYFDGTNLTNCTYFCRAKFVATAEFRAK